MRAGVTLPKGTGGIALRAALAAALGASLGLFVSGYWLIDLLPADSRQLILLTLVVAALAALLYFVLLGWIWHEVRNVNSGARLLVVLASLVLAGFLFFAGTQQWGMPGRYLGFLLPRHQLRLSAPSPSADAAKLTWFNTTIGDVSFDALDARGWSRQGDALVLTALPDNSVTWTGVTGDRIQMVFVSSYAGATIVLRWDGKDELVTLDKGKNSYDRTFSVPFQASGTLVILLGLLNAFVLSVSLILIVLQRRDVWQQAMAQSAGAKGRRLDRWDVVALVAALGLALLLRVFNLGNVFPAVDEYYHLIAAQQILQGANLGAVYQRGLWIVTLPVALALKIFGHEVWAARLMGVLFNTLALLPLYLITRKINRPAAIIACALYASSPWIVTFARVAREYAFYPFYFYWIVYLMILFAEAVPVGFVFIRDWRSVLKSKVIVLAVILALPPYFGLVVDWLSTFRTILIAYLVFGIVVLARFDWSDRRNWPLLAFLLAGLAFGGRAWYLEQSSKLLIWPRLNAVPLEYFFPNPQQQWYFERMAVIIALAIAAGILYVYASRQVAFVPGFMLLLFLTYLVVFACFSKSFFHTRHLLTTEVWYVIVTAMGLYALWTVLLAVVPLGNSWPRIALVLGLALASVNPAQIIVPSISASPDMPISEDYLHDMSKVQAFMAARVQPGDVLVSTVYGLYASWEEAPQFRSQYRITSATPREDIQKMVASSPSGWIVIDKIRLDLSTLSMRDFSNLGQVEFVGTYGDEYVWRWQHSPG